MGFVLVFAFNLLAYSIQTRINSPNSNIHGFVAVGWGVTGGANLLMGWLVGYLGLLGVEKNEVEIPALNIVGFLFCLSSLGVFFFVRPDVSNSASHKDEDENTSLMTVTNNPQPPFYSSSMSDNHQSAQPESNFGALDRLPLSQQRIFGLAGAVVAGLFFGFNFNPPQYLINNPNYDAPLARAPHSTQSLDYVFSHFSGIYFASTVYFLIYCAVKRNKPKVFIISPASLHQQ